MRFRELFTQLIRHDTVRLFAFDLKRRYKLMIERWRLYGKVVKGGDRHFVTTVSMFEQQLDQGGVDIAEQFFCRFVLDLGVLGRDGSLQNTYSLRVLTKDGFNILSSLEGILATEQSQSVQCSRQMELCTHLLEPNLEYGIQHGNGGHGLLSGRWEMAKK
jgi:hypothetical protein